ncbi:hypothetical protein DFH05DRAFT_1530656 [Lentinula detonsa]|uniref:RING-type domain-containing protein n=1 Tax=Lentinula detonsa TaxID=2804962 RepID=A0A9W8TSB5_9AGAR|nr:hypothetical protein DFH05DRAFT_1530656 [Lentinula detonsa]KAJ3793441.1 hypothetical protein GGU11DRAFT_759943 [Lentinula aff. detonsa]KAJ3979909.1 hypothetical protein F5890DRAFT_1478160 [Lentinula detonsa]
MARSSTIEQPHFTMVLRSQVKRYNLRSQAFHSLPLTNKNTVAFIQKRTSRIPPVRRPPIRARVRTSYKACYEELKRVIDPFLTCHACKRRVSQPLIPICGDTICATCVRKNRIQALKDVFLTRCGHCNKFWPDAPAPGALHEALVNTFEENEGVRGERPAKLTEEFFWPADY